MKNLILEGFMGCGKSRIASELGRSIKLEVIDTDDVIERKQGRTIAKIFEESGEEAFRDMETAVLRELSDRQEGAVISLGGGMPVKSENRKLLKELGTVIYLKADSNVLIRRLQRGVEKRPMLSGHDLKERVEQLLSEREAFYEDAADIVIEIGEDDPEKIVKRIMEKAEQ
ncbi:MAG: shikimate kinase [Lachnospiraceae bacterium]|nr:shikimate kinase [Lachnospiraceae bacterium]